MDLTFFTDGGVFNYRASAVIIHENKILAMRDDPSSHYYLPGGRVSLHETAESAVLREVKEELEVDAEIIRPLWLNENFFVMDDSHLYLLSDRYFQNKTDHKRRKIRAL